VTGGLLIVRENFLDRLLAIRMAINIPHQPTQKPAVILSLAIASVELPFLVVCLLVQELRHCHHCRQEWLSWPILPGVVPWYIAANSFRFVPRDLSMTQLRCVWGVLTVCFIVGIFALCRRGVFWRPFLGFGLALSAAMAVMTYLFIAA
jgi:hypothetical protein